jgi:Mlc titration factor MtfA (ptsG expression regulator)
MNILLQARRTRDRRRRPISGDLWLWLLEHHPIVGGLSPGELERLQELTRAFLRQKTFEAAEGLVLDEDMRAVVALQACLPVLALGLSWYRAWKTIVVVPAGFVQKHVERDRAGVVHEWEESDIGESWNHGPVVLSWKDVEASGWADGYNVVIHEAAHKLDLTDGAVNGRPALHKGMDPKKWREEFSRSFEDLREGLGRGHYQGINSYAAASDAEFFAVMSEYFFECPHRLLDKYPAVFGLLKEFYRQDPSTRLPPCRPA